VTRFRFIATARHHGTPLDPCWLQVRSGAKNLEPPLMKNGFRIAFWSVFSDAWHLADSKPVEVEWLGEHLTVQDVWAFRSGPEKFDGVEGDNYVLVYEVVSELESSVLAERLKHISRDAGRLEAHLLEAWAAALHGTPHGALLQEIEHGDNKPGFKACLVPSDSAFSEAVPWILAFYYLAVTLIFRIERAQIALPIPPTFDHVDTASMDAIAHARLRLIDFDRYFLTMNCSSNEDLQAFCAAVAGSLSVREQHARQVGMSSAMECHLSNVSNLTQAREARRTGVAVRLLTLLAVPIGLFGALSGINLGADYILRNPGGIVGNPMFWTTWAVSIAATVVLVGASVAFGSLRERVARR